jgi:spoIIIJ-associated protein
MEWVEITGRTVEEAVEASLDELGVDESDLEYEVLERPRPGLFGRIGGNRARIRARVRPVSREKPGEHQRRGRRQGSRGRGGSRPPDGRSAPADEGADRAERVAVTVAPTDAEPPAPGGPATTGTGARRRRRGGRGRGRSSARAVAGRGDDGRDGDPDASGDTEGGARGAGRDALGRSPRAPGEGKQMETMESELSVEEQAAIAESFTTGLVDAFDLGADVTVIVEDETILVSIDGSSVGLLVGPKGATLTAIEELVRTVVQRQTDGRGARINVDVGGYRAKRREALVAFTGEIAERVLAEERPIALEPMSAADRKIVHDAVTEIDGVATESEGEEPRRRVVLRPA